MPTYRVTDSKTGVVLRLTGDSPPTEQELEELFAQYAPAQKEEDGIMSSVGRIAADIGIETGAALAGATAGGTIGAALAPATLGASVPIGAAIGGLIGGLGGNTLVQRGQIERGERPEFSYGELVASGLLSAVPGGTGAKAGTSFARNVAMKATQGAALAGAGEIAKTVIDQNRLPTANEFLTATVFGGATGGALGTLEKGIGKVAALTPEAKLGNLTPIIKRVAGVQSSLAFEGEVAIKNLKDSLDAIKDKTERERVSAVAFDVLRGQPHAANLPEPVADAVTQVRGTIDNLSELLQDRGIVEEGSALYNTITDNMGAYVRRAYRALNSDWKPPAEVFNRWVDTKVKDELEQMVRKRMANNNIVGRNTITYGKPFNVQDYYTNLKQNVEPELRQKYIEEASKMLDRNNSFAFAIGDTSKVNTNIFKQRQNLDPITRELLGEIKDPIYAASNTINMMTKTQAVHQVNEEIRKVGLSTGLFRNAARAPSEGMVPDVELSADQSNYNPLKGLWTTPEVREAFNSMTTETASKLAQRFGAIASASAMLKLPKTLGSLPGYASNVWGGIMDTVAQGHALEFFRTDNWKRAGQVAGYNLGFIKPNGSIDGKEATSFFKFMREQGLVAPNVTFGDFMRSFEAGEKTLDKMLPSQVLAAGKKSISLLGKIYSTPEVSSKIFNLSGEFAALAKAYPNENKEELLKKAAERVRLTTQDYNSLPRFVKDLSSIGFLDPFVSYSADRFRVVYNTFKLGLQDMASGNPELAKAGAKRIAAMTTVLGSAGYIASNTHLTPEQDKALRNRMPDWDKNGMVAISAPAQDGTFKYTNLNYNIPHSTAIEAMHAAMRGQNPEEAFTNFMSSIGNQAFGANLLIAPLAAVATGKNRYGLPISSENEPLYKQVMQRSGYFIDQTMMPLAVNEAKKFFDALDKNGEKIVTAGGGTYGVREILLKNFGGVREQTIHLGDRMRINAAEISRNLSDDQMAYASSKRRALTEQDAQDAYTAFESRYRNTFQRASQLIADGRAIGLEDNDLVALMRAGRIPSSVILGAVSGVYVPPATEDQNPVRTIYEQIEKLPENQRSAAVEKAARENPSFGRSLVNRYRNDLKSKALGISEVDKLILAQDEVDGDRARFIFQKMQSLPDQLMRTAYLEDLKKKKIITPVVNAQLNLLLNPPR